MEFEESVLIQRTHAAKMATEADNNRRFTLHCLQCNTVLGDSLGVCGEIKCMDSIICLSMFTSLSITIYSENNVPMCDSSELTV